MKLYSYWRSSASWRVRTALHFKGVAFEYVPVHLLKDGGEQNQSAYRALNPGRTVPTLEWADGGGHVRRLSQSMAILEYLEETHPRPPLLPKDAFARGLVRQRAEQVNSGMQPLHNLSVLQRLEALGVDENAWAHEWIARGAEALEVLAKASAGKHFVGDAVTFADVLLVPQLYNLRRFHVDLAPYPTLTRLESAALKLPAFQAALPEAQPDAPAP